MRKDLNLSPPAAPRTIPVPVFTGAHYEVAVRVDHVFRWTSHTANSLFPPLFPETILYTHAG